jgi:tRNA threonylcarbamoyladenosine biosynthesis protein TsaB
MKALAIETSSAIATVALTAGSTVLLRTIESARDQAAQLLPFIAELLAAADLELAELDAIVFGRGPGSFTGLRVAAATAQGLALASGVPLVAVSSLAALAQAAYEAERVERSLVCVDAKMREVYCGVFAIRDGLAEPERPERLCAPRIVPAPARGAAWSGIGDGFGAYPDELQAVAAGAEAVYASLYPRAGDLLRLGAPAITAGRFVAVEHALPAYLRDETAWIR